MEGPAAGDTAADGDHRQLVRLPAEQERQDTPEADGEGRGGAAEGGGGAAGHAKGRGEIAMGL